MQIVVVVVVVVVVVGVVVVVVGVAVVVLLLLLLRRRLLRLLVLYQHSSSRCSNRDSRRSKISSIWWVVGRWYVQSISSRTNSKLHVFQKHRTNLASAGRRHGQTLVVLSLHCPRQIAP